MFGRVFRVREDYGTLNKYRFTLILIALNFYQRIVMSLRRDLLKLYQTEPIPQLYLKSNKGNHGKVERTSLDIHKLVDIIVVHLQVPVVVKVVVELERVPRVCLHPAHAVKVYGVDGGARGLAGPRCLQSTPFSLLRRIFFLHVKLI